MSLAATRVVPQPLAIDCAVTNDPTTRTLTVRPAQPGVPGLPWREGWRALLSAEQSAHLYAQVETVWASSPDSDRIAFATPDPDRAALKFHFQPGVAAYTALIGKPGLTATVAVDRSSGRFMSVRFRHRP